MDKYLKMADVFKFGVSDAGIKVRQNYIVENIDDSFKPMEYAAHAINSHDELVENMQHYEADALMWERRAVTEASRAQGLVAEVERLRGIIAQIKNPTNDECMKFLCTAFRHCDYEIKGDFEIDDMKPAFILYANSKGA